MQENILSSGTLMRSCWKNSKTFYLPLIPILLFYKKPPVYNPQMGVGIRKKGMRKHNRTGTNYGKFKSQGTANYFDDEGKRFPQSRLEIYNGDRTTEPA